jgi:hypothetical protein
MLKMTFGPKRVEMAEGSRKLYSKELNNSYFLQSVEKSRMMRWWST